MLGFEKSTPVSTIAITISLPDALYCCMAISEPVISPIREASGIIFSDKWKSNFESSITAYPWETRLDADSVERTDTEKNPWSDLIPYRELSCKLLSGNELEPKIKYLLKLFSIKKLESISIIFESKIIWCWELSNEPNSSKGNACELVKRNENNRNTNKSAVLDIIVQF